MSLVLWMIFFFFLGGSIPFPKDENSFENVYYATADLQPLSTISGLQYISTMLSEIRGCVNSILTFRYVNFRSKVKNSEALLFSFWGSGGGKRNVCLDLCLELLCEHMSWFQQQQWTLKRHEPALKRYPSQRFNDFLFGILSYVFIHG